VLLKTLHCFHRQFPAGRIQIQDDLVQVGIAFEKWFIGLVGFAH
jgi:hypothetical protein